MPRFNEEVVFQPRILGMHGEDLLTDFNRICVPLSFHVVESKSEANTCILIIRHFKSRVVVAGCLYVVSVLFFYEAHVLKCLDVGLIILEHFAQFLFCLVEHACADVVVCRHQPRSLEIVRVLELELVRYYWFQVTTRFLESFLQKFAKCHDHKCWNVLFIFCE